MTTERSSRLVPDDPRSHVERINDWRGSNVFVQMSRRDREDTPMPEGKTFKYILKMPAFVDGVMVPAGSEIELAASQVGPQHLPMEGEKYDAAHKAAVEAMNVPRRPPTIEETISLSHHREVVAALQPEIDRLREENAVLKAAIDKQVAAAVRDEKKS
jgi:hypothetical protein